ncbi:MAG: hypothetical protein RLZZ584_1526 [Pseudomonadota bacterium]|jgi:hypothetical protein
MNAPLLAPARHPLAATPQRVVLQIRDMNGPASAERVRAAAAGLDALAVVGVDLTSHCIDIVSTAADAYDFADAIASAGYTPVLLLWHAQRPG